MKCRWKHCKYGGEVDKDKAVKVGIAYFHPECYAERQAIQKIIDVWHERVDAYPMESMLRKMVNDLVLKQNVNAEFLLFALNYCLDNGWNLRYPAGLKAVSKDDKARKAWDVRQERIIKKKMKEQTEQNDSIMDFNLPKTNSSYSNKPKFSSVLGV